MFIIYLYAWTRTNFTNKFVRKLIVLPVVYQLMDYRISLMLYFKTGHDADIMMMQGDFKIKMPNSTLLGSLTSHYR